MGPGMGDASSSTALIVVDVQYDFISGSLAVRDAATILPTLHRLLDQHRWKLVLASQDYHPSNHISFASSHENLSPFTTITLPGTGMPQELWPDHCVVDTRGAEIEESIQQRFNQLGARLVQKGTEVTVDAYSAFAPTNGENVSIVAKSLIEAHVTSIVVVGIATDYCVRQTVLSALALPQIKDIYVVREGVKGVDEVGSAKTLLELESKGVRIVSIDGEEMKRYLK